MATQLDKGYYFLNNKFNSILITSDSDTLEPRKTKLSVPIILYCYGQAFTAHYICYSITANQAFVWFEDSAGKQISGCTQLADGSFRMFTVVIEVQMPLPFADLVLDAFFAQWPYTFLGESRPDIAYGQWQFPDASFDPPVLSAFSQWAPVSFFLNNGEKFIGIKGDRSTFEQGKSIVQYVQEDETPITVFDGVSWTDPKYQTIWLSEIITEDAAGPRGPDLILKWILWYNQAEYIDSPTYSIVIDPLPHGLIALELNETQATQYRQIQITPQLETNYALTSLTYRYGNNAPKAIDLSADTYEFIMPNKKVFLTAETTIINPYQGFAVATMFGQRLKSAGNYPLIRAQDVEMKDGTRLHDFNPLPPVGEEGMVLKVENGKWAAGWTIRAERDDEDSAILNIF